jgi:hypothetical protein
MYSQSVFSLESFPYDACYTRWVNARERVKYGVVA